MPMMTKHSSRKPALSQRAIEFRSSLRSGVAHLYAKLDEDIKRSKDPETLAHLRDLRSELGKVPSWQARYRLRRRIQPNPFIPFRTAGRESMVTPQRCRFANPPAWSMSGLRSAKFG